MRVWVRVLVFSTVVLLLLCGISVAGGVWLWSNSALNTAGKIDFEKRVAVPPLAKSRVDGDGTRVFNLTASEGEHDFGGQRVPTWGFNGDYLGPTLRAERGERVKINVRNELSEATTVHWHGMHLPAKADGGPHQMVEPGETWSPSWRVDQPATTLWYHPHPHRETAEHVYRGLAGMFILDDPASKVKLPHEYGVDDVPVIVQDKKIDGGELDDSDSSGVGVLGDTVVVNGTVAPYLPVTTERVRLRLLNASNARVYDFGLADGRKFELIGTDGGLLAEPHRTDRIQLSVGERAEIVVTVRPGERTVLRSYPPELGINGFAGRFVGGDDTLDVLQLRAAKKLADSPEVPRRLADIPRLDPSDAAERRTFKLSGHNINGNKMDMDRIDTTVTKGTTEVWEVYSNETTTHSFHVHDVQFQVVSVDGGAPPPQLSGWKDTIYLPEGVRFEIIMRFADYADPDTPYMYHCHMLIHEDRGMMGQFLVVEPGQRPDDHSGHGGGDSGHGGHGG